MKISLIEKLACPFDKSDLDLRIITKERNEIKEGILTCSQCHRYYPIVYGVPIMSPDEFREKGLEQPLLLKWGLPAATEQDSFRLSLPTATREKD